MSTSAEWKFWGCVDTRSNFKVYADIEVLEETEGVLEETEGVLEEMDGVLDEMEGVLEETDGVLKEVEGVLEVTDGVLEEMKGLLEEVEGVLEEVEEEEGVLRGTESGMRARILVGPPVPFVNLMGKTVTSAPMAGSS
ncbi:hypothetical protein FHG87_007510 [Trinorchestia longiramus]|nr:hypothetical protein FHG87_007510 [Trinorchestia longiramus]